MAENLKFQRSRVSFSPVGTPRMSISGAGQVGSAIQAAGGVLQEHADRQQKEHDLARVLDATTNLRQVARGKMSEALKKEGADAAGVLKEYQEWYVKQAGELAKTLDNNDQRLVFQNEATARKEHDLDNLARHQATEHKKHLKAALTGTIATAEQDVVQDPFNVERMNQSFDRIQEALNLAYPGVSTKDLYDKAVSGIRFSALQEMVKKDPIRARKFLEKWKGSLGAAYDQAQDLVEKEAMGFEVDMLFPGDFDAQEDYVASKDGVSADVRRAVIGRIRSDEAEAEHRRNEAKRLRREDGYNAFWEAMTAHNYGDAKKIVEGWSGEDFTMRERYIAQQLTENVTMKTNPYSERSLFMDVKRGKIKTPQDLYSDPRIADLTIEDVRQLESDLKKEDASPIQQSRAFTLLEQRFDRLFRDTEFYGMKPTFDKWLLEDVEAEEAAKGRRLTGSEVIETGNRLLEEQTKEIPFWFDKTTTRFQQRVEKEETGKAETKKPGEAQAVNESIISKALPHIPPETVTQIIKDLGNAGRAVNADTVNKMYLQNQEHYRAPRQP